MKIHKLSVLLVYLLLIQTSLLKADSSDALFFEFCEFSFNGYKCKDCNRGMGIEPGKTGMFYTPIGNDVYCFEATPLNTESGVFLNLTLSVSEQDPDTFDRRSTEQIQEVINSGQFRNLGSQMVTLKENRYTEVTYGDLTFSIAFPKDTLVQQPEFQIVRDESGDVISGEVGMYFRITETGNIDNIKIFHSDSELLNEFAIKGMEKAVYAPPEMNGKQQSRMGRFTAIFGQ